MLFNFISIPVFSNDMHLSAEKYSQLGVLFEVVNKKKKDFHLKANNSVIIMLVKKLFINHRNLITLFNNLC